MTTRLWLVLAVLAATAGTVRAEGHGPVFGLATPTLGQGGWSSDTALVTMRVGSDGTYALREMIGYGLTEDLQVTVTFPLLRVGGLPMPHRARMGAMMTGASEIEAFVLWRFHRRAPNAGTRWESTLLVGGTVPTEGRRASWGRRSVGVGPSVHAAVVAGYASRKVYAWVGVGYQRYFSRDGDRLGDLPYVSAVFGWRPPMFRHDYPRPDWRLFLEGLAEFPGRDRVGGVEDPASGGRKVLLGPSVLGLYGPWGLSAGVLFPVVQRLSGPHPREAYRAKVVFTVWLD